MKSAASLAVGAPPLRLGPNDTGPGAAFTLWQRPSTQMAVTQPIVSPVLQQQPLHSPLTQSLYTAITHQQKQQLSMQQQQQLQQQRQHQQQEQQQQDGQVQRTGSSPLPTSLPVEIAVGQGQLVTVPAKDVSIIFRQNKFAVLRSRRLFTSWSQ